MIREELINEELLGMAKEQNDEILMGCYQELEGKTGESWFITLFGCFNLLSQHIKGLSFRVGELEAHVEDLTGESSSDINSLTEIN